MNTTEPALLRLLQLSSANLPVGAYAFSQGLEYAIEARWIKRPAQVHEWLSLQLQQSLATVDIPILFRLQTAVAQADWAGLQYWNDYVLACRETRELQLTDTAAGEGLQRLLPQLGISLCAGLDKLSFVTGFAQAAQHWRIAPRMAALGYCWSWLENQVNAATKLLPLGQTQAQQLLHHLQEEIPMAIDYADGLLDEQLGASLPGLSLASMLHETQYTRLFRS